MVDAAGGGDAVHGGRERLPRHRVPHADHPASSASREETPGPSRQGEWRSLLLGNQSAPAASDNPQMKVNNIQYLFIYQ